MSSDKFKIKEVIARQILDSRGNPTVECEVECGRGRGKASVPSGASRGRHEALELRDEGTKYHGQSVTKAVKNVEEKLAPKLKGIDCRKQTDIDNIMLKADGTDNKRKLGANAILAVSIATAKAAADTLSTPLFKYLQEKVEGKTPKTRVLPVPLMNLINGGAHAGNDLAIQEFWVLPIGATSFPEAIRMGSEIYHTLGELLEEKFGESATNVGDEGGFAPPLSKTEQAIEVLVEGIKESGFDLGQEVFLGMDSASTNFYSPAKEKYAIDGKMLAKGEMIEFYKDLVARYPILALEDPLFEEDFKGFMKLTKELQESCLIIGDDLFATNPKRLKRGVNEGAANALILKVNQIGTLTEAFKVAEIAEGHEYRIIVSHRSGETTDTFISDLSVALNSGLIKTGAPARGERTCKYNRLLRINELVKHPQYPDLPFLR